MRGCNSVFYDVFCEVRVYTVTVSYRDSHINQISVELCVAD